MKKLALLCSLAALPNLTHAQQCTLQAISSFGASGVICDPFSCTPPTLSANAPSQLLLFTKGARWQPHVLMVSGTPAPCVSVPGIGNQLLVAAPGLASVITFNWLQVYVQGPPPVCGGWIGNTPLSLPSLPGGLFLRLQLLAPVPTVNGPQWMFSNALDVTIV